MTQYKSAQDLGISVEEFDGLIAIMNHLRDSHIIHASTGTDMASWIDVAPDEVVQTRIGFNMGVPTGTNSKTKREYDCGCVACIGGHLSLYLQGVNVLSASLEPVILEPKHTEVANNYVIKREYNSPFSDLFYPKNLSQDWDGITPATAAQAIENFLTSGDPNWEHACRVNGQSSFTEIDDDD